MRPGTKSRSDSDNRRSADSCSPACEKHSRAFSELVVTPPISTAASIDFFQRERVTGRAKGIVEVDLEAES